MLRCLFLLLINGWHIYLVVFYLFDFWHYQPCSVGGKKSAPLLPPHSGKWCCSSHMVTGRIQTRNSLTDDFKSWISPSAGTYRPHTWTASASASVHPATLMSDPNFNQTSHTTVSPPSVNEGCCKKKKKWIVFIRTVGVVPGCQVAIWFCCHNKEKWLKIMIRKNWLEWLNIFVSLEFLSSCSDISVYLLYVLFKPSATLNAWSSCSTEMIRFKKRKETKTACRAQRQHWCHAEVFPTLCPQKNKKLLSAVGQSCWLKMIHCRRFQPSGQYKWPWR